MDTEPRNEWMTQVCQRAANLMASNFGQAVSDLEKDAAENLDDTGGEVVITVRTRLFLGGGQYSDLADITTTRTVRRKDKGELHTFVPGEVPLPGLEG